MIFIKKNLWEVAIKLNNNYRKWRKLRADISKIGKEILTLLDEIEKESTVKLSEISIADSNE
jgi:AAA+ superfamily predicted ATPase